MNSSNPTHLAFIIFHKLHQGLPRLGEDLSENRLRELILEAINLLPDYTAFPTETENRIVVRNTRSKKPFDVVLDIQHSIDSLRTILLEYQNMHSSSAG